MNRTSFARNARHWEHPLNGARSIWSKNASLILLTIAMMCMALLAQAQISISHLSTYATGSYNTAAAEIVTFDPVNDRIFFVNAQLNQVVALNASNPAAPTLAFTLPMGAYGASANSVTVVPGGIAVAVEANPKTDPGKVVFFDANGTFLSQVTVGALPDMVTATPDGTKVLVANEGEPNTAYTIDPQGTVSVINITGGLATLTNANVSTIDFTTYTSAMLPGVRIFGPGATVAQDMEPEYITVSDDSQKAFVACQENNCVVRIDLATNTIEQITALGWKDHSLSGNGLDASDSPTGVNIANWPVRGFYMPDAIDSYTVGGQTYVVYANEGDAREYTPLNEARRIGNALYPLDATSFPNAATLKQNANLGRLNATISSGDTDNDGDYDEIYVFGSRSFTIRDASGVIVYDSGDDLEQITSAAYPTNFNSNNSANGSFDTRSDDKGPEPEAVAIGKVGSQTYAFIGLERIGGVMVYDITVPSAPVFIQYLNHRNFAGNAAAGTALDLGVESIVFVSASQSPDGKPFIITSNEVSGTVSLFRINGPGHTGPSTAKSPYALPLGAGNTTTSILTVGDVISGYDMVGLPDGMGAFDNNDGTFTLLVNHEIGATLGVVRDHGFAGSFVSKWVINKSDLSVVSGEDLIQTVLDWNGTSFVPASVPLGRLCSGDLPALGAFYNAGTGKGSQERIFLSGEEVGSEGRAYAHIATGSSAGISYQLPHLGRFSWENAVANPTTSNKTIVVGLDDTTPGQVYVYVGTKQSTGNEIEKAGLFGGKLYGVKANNITVETPVNFPANTTFSLFDLGQVQNTAGASLQATSVANGITEFLRPEDGHWDPINPNVFYFVTTASFSGANATASRLYKLTFFDILQPEMGGTIEAVLNGAEGQRMMDNMCVDQLGNAYIQEDPGNQTHIAKIWKYDIATDALTQVAYHDSARFLSGAPHFLTQDEESSGIIDMRDILGKGRYLFNVEAHYAIPGELVEGGQLLEFATGDTIAPCVPAAITAITPATVSCSSEALALSVAASGTLPLTYTWSGDGSFLLGSTNPSALVADAATGSYAVTVSNACGSDDDAVAVVVNIVGHACNDNDPNTVLDTFDGSCTCIGVACTMDLVLAIQTDDNGSQISWELREQGSNILFQSGGGAYPNYTTVEEVTCLPDGCYYLRVLDAGGDGVTGGGYILRTSAGQRIIDNRYNFTTGSVSEIANNEGFCLPLGMDALIAAHCDVVGWSMGQTIQAVANPLVSAEFGIGNQADDGYQFWIFDPNGTYSYKVFHAHSQALGQGGADAIRATKVKLNAFLDIPSYTLLNVRVRSRVNGVNAEWGPSCRLMIQPNIGNCPQTQLNPVAGVQFSCGVTRTTDQTIWAKSISGANQYEFRFRLASENTTIVRTSPTRALVLNWAGPDALMPGATYDVDVRARKDTTWCVSGPFWGSICQVTITSAFAGGEQHMATEFDATSSSRIHPNPNRGDQLYISLENIEEGVNTVSVDIYDSFGKRVSSRTMAVADGTITSVLELNGEFASGMYVVHITAGTHVFTERLVIQP